ncbi:MAG: Na+/H+ antiporter [Bacteroidota bacterium]|nr:MAG: Na+/H+ antiporter [Bacteroidota bacterium]
MVGSFSLFLASIIAIVFLVMLANKIKVAYPILLVVAGLLISFVPGVPMLHIEPDLIFIIFLPPLLYEAAWAISWKELWKWRRIIGSFAFVVVFLTALFVAFVANTFIPGFSLALGFLLGGIVSPPDAVSTGAILKFVKVPKRVSSILEGESLLNDASALIIFRFAMITVATGQFVWYSAALNFGWMLIGGIGIGLLVGWIFMKIHKLLPMDVRMDIVLTIVTPYLMYIAAEEVHSSGVLSVVSGGLFLSHKRLYFLNSATRLAGTNVWEGLVFVLNGLVFLLIGLELPEITSGLHDISISTAVEYGLLITLVLILGRFLAAYGAVLVTMIMRNFITVADSRYTGLRGPMILAWAGMRGVVSLAAALSIPGYLSDGTEFPQRNLILFITFIVILSTLLLQGLTLPYLIKKIKLPDFGDYIPEEEADHSIKIGLAKHSLEYVNNNHVEQLKASEFLQQIAARWENNTNENVELSIPAELKSTYLKALEQQRQWLIAHNRENERIDEEVIRKYLLQIDLEEERLKHL